MAPTDESFGQRERVCARGIYVHPTATTPNMPHTRESEELGLRDELLRDHAGDGNHGEPAVVQLLRLHRLELGRVRRRQAERVPAAVVAAQRAGGPRRSLAPAKLRAALSGSLRAELLDTKTLP